MNTVKNTFLELKKQRKEFYYTAEFHREVQKLEEITQIQIITDEKLIHCLESILVNNRQKIFYIPQHKYSVIYESWIIHKYFLDDIIFVIEPFVKQ